MYITGQPQLDNNKERDVLRYRHLFFMVTDQNRNIKSHSALHSRVGKYIQRSFFLFQTSQGYRNLITIEVITD